MARSCRLVRDGHGVEALWRRDGDALVLSPRGAPPLAIALAEVSGISGDGHSVQLRLPDGEVALERLGGDGATLLQELRRDWPVLRADVLRLSGGEQPRQVFVGTMAGSGNRGPVRGWICGTRFLLAPDGGDLFAIFLADVAAIAFDESAYCLRLTAWDGGEIELRGFGPASTALLNALREARESLAAQSMAVIGGFLPTLSAGGRAALAGEWLPGRLLSFESLERLAAGFDQAFRGSWLPATLRAASGEALMAGVSPADRFLAYAAPAAGEPPFLWLVVRQGETTSLEVLSHEDYATYLFRTEPAVTGLLEGLTRLPEFSREALYLPLEQLTGDRALYAIPARVLPMLRDLRKLFKGRKIHAPSSG